VRVLVCYEEHSGASGASSDWQFDPAPLKSPVFVGGGTHKKYLTIVKKGTTATLTRISNRGNVRVEKVIIDEPAFLDFVGGKSHLPDKYAWFAKQKLRWRFDLPKTE